MPSGRLTKYNETVIAKKVDEYLSSSFDSYDDKDKQTVKLPTISGLALYIGVCEDTMYEWAKHHPTFSESLKVIKGRQKNRLLNKGLSGDYNSTIAKLILSSNHGMSDKSQTDITSDGKALPTTINIINPG